MTLYSTLLAIFSVSVEVTRRCTYIPWTFKVRALVVQHIDTGIARVLATIPGAPAALALRADLAVTPKIAAALTGRSPQHVRDAVDRAELAASGTVHRSIPITGLSA